jgi:hypothetical protein
MEFTSSCSTRLHQTCKTPSKYGDNKHDKTSLVFRIAYKHHFYKNIAVSCPIFGMYTHFYISQLQDKMSNDYNYISTLAFYHYRLFELYILMATQVFFTICPSLGACRWYPIKDSLCMWMVKALLLLAYTKQAGPLIC